MCGCCGDQNDEEKTDLTTRAKNRGCTDIIVLILFVIFWAGMIYIAAFSILHGDAFRLVYGYDSFGNTCDSDNTNRKVPNVSLSGMNMKGRRFVFFMDVEDPFTSKCICVNECPKDELEKKADVQHFSHYIGSHLCEYNVAVENYTKQTYGIKGPCPKLPVPASEPLLHFCIPRNLDKVKFKDTVIGYLNARDIFHKVLSDLINGWREMMLLCLCALGFSGLMVLLIRFLASVIVWVILAVSMIASIVGTCFLWWTYVDIKNKLDKDEAINLPLLDVEINSERAFLVYSIVATVLTVILLLVILIMRKRISLVVALFHEAGRCISSVPCLLLQPVYTFILLIAFFMYWVILLLVILIMRKRISLVVALFHEAGRCISSVPCLLLQPVYTFILLIAFFMYWVILLLVILIMRKRISLVVALFHEAGRCISSVPCLLLQPVYTFILLIAFFMYWVIVLAFLSTSGVYMFVILIAFFMHWVIVLASLSTSEIASRDSEGYVKYTEHETVSYMWWYHLIGLIWTSEFIIASQQLIICGAVASWYFSRTKKDLGCPIMSSIKLLVFHHLGSVAFGALVITAVKLPRMILMYMHKKLKGSENQCAKYCMKCCICCLWCLEKCLKYLNQNAYTIIAIQGSNFCKSAAKSFTTLVSNALRVAAINSVGDFILFLGKIGVMAATAAVGILWFKSRDDLHYYAVPVLLVCVFAYFIASSFLSTYEMVIDAMLLCFCHDCDINDGSVERPYFASESLQSFIDGTSKSLNRLNRESGTEEEAEPARV